MPALSRYAIQAAVRARAYDLVLNGIELASGSVRITDPALQNRMFRTVRTFERGSKRKIRVFA